MDDPAMVIVSGNRVGYEMKIFKGGQVMGKKRCEWEDLSVSRNKQGAGALQLISLSGFGSGAGR